MTDEEQFNAEKRIEFLTTAISDAQELIRFTDTKTAFIFTILSAYVVAFFNSIEKFIKYPCDYSCWFWIFALLYILLMIVCVIVTVRIIKPTNNPVDNINFENTPKPTLNFFLATNDYSKGGYAPVHNSKHYKLTESFKDYSKEINAATDSKIIDSLTLELLKVSFIRNIKNERLDFLLWLLLATTVSFIIAYLMFSVQIQEAINLIEATQKKCCNK